jgi:hypothetical protein
MFRRSIRGPLETFRRSSQSSAGRDFRFCGGAAAMLSKHKNFSVDVIATQGFILHLLRGFIIPKSQSQVFFDQICALWRREAADSRVMLQVVWFLGICRDEMV